ncbi:MAG: hypothetical protein RBQ91_06340 [Acholeplasma sp.]|nr:hypothetical protein [Acholeplasma sp.]
MDIDLLEIELNGISGTITNYTRNPYIIGYIDALKRFMHEHNEKMIMVIVGKLVDWYKSSIDEILNNDYISNKQDHLSTKKLLESILSYQKIKQ